MCAYPSRHHTGPHPSQDMAAPRGPGPVRLARSRVTKTLQPGQPGTTRWQNAYGDHLVCVRYREDLQANARYVTVELVLETRPLARQPPQPIVRPHPTQPNTLIRQEMAFDAPRSSQLDPRMHDELAPEENSRPDPPIPHRQRPNDQVGVRIALDESALQKQARQHGAEWSRVHQLWLMPRATAEELGWTTRITPF